MEFVKKICGKCQKEKKFRSGAENEPSGICGDCWDWENHQPRVEWTVSEWEET